VAKLHGPERAVPGGFGVARASEEGVTVAALAAVNAFGEVVEEDGTVLAGALPGDDGEDRAPWPGTSTTIAVVATDAALTRERAHLLSVAAHDGMARAVRPAHTMWDGDTVFTLATGGVEASQAVVERLAEGALAEAIRRAVRRSSEGPAARKERSEH
jgi:L-aminopeptidase/D-esterase-like protein